MKCPLCRFKAKTKTDLARHMETAHCKVIAGVLLLLLLGISGCQRYHAIEGTDVAVATEQKVENRAAAFHVVSCCMDNNETGHPTYPSFLPDSQVKLCTAAHAACLTNCQIDGEIYLPMGVDCGRYPYKVGDQFYPATGY